MPFHWDYQHIMSYFFIESYQRMELKLSHYLTVFFIFTFSCATHCWLTLLLIKSIVMAKLAKIHFWCTYTMWSTTITIFVLQQFLQTVSAHCLWRKFDCNFVSKFVHWWKFLNRSLHKIYGNSFKSISQIVRFWFYNVAFFPKCSQWQCESFHVTLTYCVTCHS